MGVWGKLPHNLHLLTSKESENSFFKVGTMYKVCAIHRNARTCLYGSSTSEALKQTSPSKDEYFWQVQER